MQHIVHVLGQIEDDDTERPLVANLKHSVVVARTKHTSKQNKTEKNPNEDDNVLT